jgi:hypothetical protein
LASLNKKKFVIKQKKRCFNSWLVQLRLKNNNVMKCLEESINVCACLGCCYFWSWFSILYYHISESCTIFLILLFSSQAIDFFITIHVLFKLASFPCTKSDEFLEFMKRRNKSRWVRMNFEWMKRFLKSCPPSWTVDIFCHRDSCINILITLLLL